MGQECRVRLDGLPDPSIGVLRDGQRALRGRRRDELVERPGGHSVIRGVLLEGIRSLVHG